MAAESSVSTTLCDIEALVAVDEGRVPDADIKKYREAVDAALVACEASSPRDRFRLVETAGGNFLLVTNALPKERSEQTQCGDTSLVGSERNEGVFDGLLSLSDDRASGAGLIASIPSVPGYAAKTVTALSYDGRMLSGSYVVYTKEQLKRSLSTDKRAIVEKILKFVDTPGILDHNNVSDPETLLWLLFCGPQSLCQNPTCFGRDRECELSFPALLPPVFYDTVTDYSSYINLAELYVYVWYKDYDFSSESAGCYDLGEVAMDRVKKTLASVCDRFGDKNVPVWPISSRICIFCALYNQNRVCLDLAKNDINFTAYSPIIVKDCRDAATNVTLSHVLPDNRAASLFPVYDIGILSRVLCDSSDGEERRKRVRENIESAISCLDD
ncbi:B95 [Murid betaherpesvirus 8]|uniref:B95 n=2 Tax=Rat cytomegalovirus (isolate England) TaxID=1261657 RepID=K7YA61_RCMVE|nr:E95 [Murid betaherpesvirus 8]AKE44263.1 a95 [Rat cytomegalovirus ALL-03]AFX83409.1 E95 [Murid betaherpesvirus 8]AKB93289.1 B95 [Murid betaherpesvirus 8]WEG71882.1 protein UL95 [Murid betaherpesvirus 8]WPH25004.1 B95 [Murid betaherpesvirus 8]